MQRSELQTGALHQRGRRKSKSELRCINCAWLPGTNAQVQIFRKQEQTFFFIHPPPYVVCLCLCLCVKGQRGHSCWRGANVMRMFTRLQVTVPLTLPGRSSTLAQSLHLTPHTHMNTHTHARSDPHVNTLTLYFFSLSLSLEQKRV